MWIRLFETGEYVVYGHTGICQVTGVTTMKMDGVPNDRLYYVLHPESGNGGTIFTPVENPKVVLRRIMTKEEVEELLGDISGIETLDIANEKLREAKYKECMKSCDSRDLVKIIKTIYLRKKDRSYNGKKATATDERYLKMAEDSLYSEMSLLLGVPKSDMVSYIKNRLEKEN